MNTYKITFTRENGTVGSDNFTAPSEAQARRDFKEVYRHGNGTITSVELVSSDAPATKRQERAALEKIRKIVDELGPDSYIATAFDGCFKDAEANIENDWALSMKDRWLTSDRELNDANGTIEELRDKLAESEKDSRGSSRQQRIQIAEEKDAEIASLKSRLLADDDLADISRLLSKTVADLGKEVNDAAARIVEVADQPESAAFRNAVKDHRAAKADLSHWTEVLTRVNTAKGRA